MGSERKPRLHCQSNRFRQMFSAVTQVRSEFSQNFINTPASTGHPALVPSDVLRKSRCETNNNGTKNLFPRTVTGSGLKNLSNGLHSANDE